MSLALKSSEKLQAFAFKKIYAKLLLGPTNPEIVCLYFSRTTWKEEKSQNLGLEISRFQNLDLAVSRSQNSVLEIQRSHGLGIRGLELQRCRVGIGVQKSREVSELQFQKSQFQKSRGLRFPDFCSLIDSMIQGYIVGCPSKEFKGYQKDKICTFHSQSLYCQKLNIVSWSSSILT